MSKLVSILTVNFNGGALLGECVRAALSSSVPVEMFVADNASSDGSMAMLKKAVAHDERLHYRENTRNIGFSAANNRLLFETTGDYVLFLNPDCIIKHDTLEKMLNYMEANPLAGMAGCLLANPDGSEQAGCRRRVPTPWRTLVRVLFLDKLFDGHRRFQNFALSKEALPERPVEEEAISGAFMLVRRTALEDVGPMDEGYFLHCEDLDWCMRFRQKGWKIIFMPNVKVIHTKGVCSDARPVRVEWHKHKGMVRFYRKFFRHQYPFLLMWCVIVLVWLRFTVLAASYTARRLVH